MEIVITSDRFGNIYVGGGITAGKSLTVVNGSFVTGWIGSSVDQSYPSETDTRSFLSGSALNLSAGVLGGTGVMLSPNSNTPHVAGVEGGMYSPQIGGSYTRSYELLPVIDKLTSYKW